MAWKAKTYSRDMSSPVRTADSRSGTSASRGYGSRWQKYTARFLGKTRGRRQVCIACTGKMYDAVLVDHIIPVRQDTADPDNSGARDEVFWPGWNHQPLCRLHHTQKTHTQDDWYTANRATLLRTIDGMLTSGAEYHDIRNWLIRQNDMWPYGWFDLNPEPEHNMRILLP